MNRADLAKEAVRAAARLRADLGIGPSEIICPYDIAEQLKLSVRFVAIPNLEGMYSPSPKPSVVLIGTTRPANRRRYTCGHEIGHHVFEHGFRIDQLDESNSAPTSPEEYLAQRFSGALLMPKLAIDAAFSKRGWKVKEGTEVQFLIIAQEFGVGFTTLITHQELNSQITSAHAEKLRKTNRASLCHSISGFPPPNDVYLVDAYWARKTIDVEVGDIIVTNEEFELSGECAAISRDPKLHLIATEQGIGKLKLLKSSNEIILRVSRRNFIGDSRYRHLEEPKDDA